MKSRAFYPKVVIQLPREEGNVFAVVQHVSKALRDANVPDDRVLQYLHETAGHDYATAIMVTKSWVNVRPSE